MSIDVSSILSIQQPNIANALANGMALRSQRDEMERGNALRGFFQANGGALLSGDRNALAGYAALDPAAAMGLQSDLINQDSARLGMEAQRLSMDAARQGMGFDAERMQFDRDQARMVAEDRARQLSAEDLAREHAELQEDLRGASFFHARGDRDGFDAYLAQAGVAPGTVTFDDFPAQAARMGEVLDTWQGFLPAAPEVREVGGQLYAVAPDGSGASLVPGIAPPAPEFSVLTPEEAAAQGLPPGAYQRGQDGRIDTIGGASTTVNVGAGENAFDKKAGELLAQQAVDTVTQGAAAQRALGQLGALEGALAQAPQGAQGAWVARLADLGIPMEGADDVQAAQAIISQLVPQQRPPGSGTMSDADLALFQQSIPRIINQPGGNALIIDTMRRIAEYDMARAGIAQRLIQGGLTQEQAFQEYAALGNPIPDSLRGAGGPAAAPAAPTAPAPAAVPPAAGAVPITSMNATQLNDYANQPGLTAEDYAAIRARAQAIIEEQRRGP